MRDRPAHSCETLELMGLAESDYAITPSKSLIPFNFPLQLLLTRSLNPTLPLREFTPESANSLPVFPKRAFS